MLAIVSDIHSNLEALTAVLADMERRGVREVVCLGDVIGYGPSPAECLQLAIERFRVTLCGNHEWALLNEPLGFHRVAREAILWQRAQLEPRWYTSKRRADRWSFLRSLPLVHRRGKLLFVHASPSHPTDEYLLRTDIDEILHELGPKLRRAFDKTSWVTFVGHTHYPGIFTEDAHFLVPKAIDGRYRLEPGRKAIVNVGSVGQPRDGDPRACYVTLSEGVLRFHRIEYDVRETVRKVAATGTLDRSLGERLLSGS
ncbi:MAG: metallophosphoesterase [Planctomycetota bacterium]|nr:MAG: metallophosphoesterase [Planctomycetota bacterium]